MMHNFSAGPAMLPVEVRERLADELAPGADGAPSIAEVSHRGERFLAVAEELRARLRSLMALGDDHEILLLPGGVNLQFAWLPMNLAAGRSAGYLISGHWSRLAFEEAERIGPATVVGSSEPHAFHDLPEIGHLPADCAYLYYCGNETIHGLQFEHPPQAGVPLAADVTSEFLSRPYPYDELAWCCAGAQKNLGIAGLTVVVVRRDWLERIPDDRPHFLDYRHWIERDSMANTPVTLAWYAALEVLRWTERQGGPRALAGHNRKKAAALYRAIDAGDFYINRVAPQARSLMNVPFHLADEALTPVFVDEAERAGLHGLKGHRVLGGLRASLYNAQTLDAVESLIDFMREFERRHG